MSAQILAKRRRGGQPGNQNARGNRSNSHPRKNFNNHGGAPIGNQNARKRQTLETDLLRRYGRQPELLAWIEAHGDVLSEIIAPHDEQRDPALYAGVHSPTLETLAEKKLEYACGLYTSLPYEDEDEKLVA